MAHIPALSFRSRDVTDALISLKLTMSVEKDCTETYRVLHGVALPYVQQFMCTADIHSRHRSSVTDSLFVPAVRLSTVGRVPSMSLELVYRMICRRTLPPHVTVHV